MKINVANKIAAEMNKALKEDPIAMWALMHNQVPCHSQVGDRSKVLVNVSPMIEGHQAYLVNALGLVNLAVEVATGCRIYSKWEGDQLLGFGAKPTEAFESA